MKALPIPADLFSRADIVSRSELSESGCWLWTDGVTGEGYGTIRRQTAGGWHLFGAHRVSYTAFVGHIPEGLVIDHVCRVVQCVNPTHLEAVTPRENTRRGIGPASAAIAALDSGYCINGHEIAKVGLHKNGRRSNGPQVTCAQCGRDRVARYKAKRSRATEVVL